VSDAPDYLQPYLRASARHGAGFRSLLWASPGTQRARFDAFVRLVDFNGKSVLDVGCGRGDFLDHLLERNIRPAEYMGLEAVEVLAAAAQRKGTIIHADFVREPRRMYTGSDVIVFSGSLNTLSGEQFYQTLRHAWEATAQWVVFNFLSAPLLAGAEFLQWHRMDDVLCFVKSLSGEVAVLEDYLAGDSTVAVRKVET
jgi:SAM-dependent methyltransferase